MAELSATSNERALAAAGCRQRSRACTVGRAALLSHFLTPRARGPLAGKQRVALLRAWRCHARPATGLRTPRRLRLRQGRVSFPIMTPR